MIDREHDLSITKQAEVLKISRGSVYYLPRPVSSADLAIMRRLDQLHLEFPFAGSRMLRGLLAAEGSKIGRRHVKTLMRRMGIEALYRRPRTTNTGRIDQNWICETKCLDAPCNLRDLLARMGTSIAPMWRETSDQTQLNCQLSCGAKGTEARIVRIEF